MRKTLFITGLFWLICQMSVAQQFTHNYIKYKRSGLDSRQTAAVVDHNHDGVPDVVSSFESGFDILRYTNEDKTYTTEVVGDSFSGYNMMQTIDINSDGHHDVLNAYKNNSGRWALGLWLNNGQNAFTHIRVGSIDDPTDKVVVADFDNDGDKDIMLDPRGRNYFWYYENDGKLNFSQEFVNFDGSPAFLFGIDDLNNDGLLDLIGAAFNFDINDYELMAVEQDTNQQDRWIPHVFDQVDDIQTGITGNFHGSAAADLLFGPQTNLQTTGYLYSYTGNFSFQKSSAITLPKYLDLQQTVDYNGDGRLDVFYADLNGIHVLEGKGNRQFTKGKTLSGDQGLLVAWTDMNNDGLNDLVHLNSYGVDIRYQQTNGNYRPFWRSGWWGFENVQIDDINEDGTLDILTTGNTEVFTIPQSIDEKLLPASQQTPTNIIADFEEYDHLHQVDYDNDGDMDYLAIYERGLYWLNNQNGSFTALQQAGFTNMSGPIVQGDIDGDANLDFLIFQSPRVQWFEWDGNSFTTTYVGFGGYQYGLDDVDGDNDMDVLFVDYTVSTRKTELKYAENNGGTFTTKVLFDFDGFLENVTDFESRMMLDDLDGDGDQDVVFSIFEDDQVALMYKTGNAQYQDSSVFNNITQVNALASADLNLDKQMDIVALGKGFGRLYTFMNQSAKGFRDTLIAEKSGFGSKMQLVDFDKDGDMDIFTVSNPSANLSYFENQQINCRKTFSEQNISLCEGDSIQIGNEYYQTAVTILDSNLNTNNCDSVAIYTIALETDPGLRILNTNDDLYLNAQVDSTQWYANGNLLNGEKRRFNRPGALWSW